MPKNNSNAAPSVRVIDESIECVYAVLNERTQQLNAALRELADLKLSEPAGYQQRYIDPEEGPSIWKACDKHEFDIASTKANYEVRKVYAFDGGVSSNSGVYIDGVECKRLAAALSWMGCSSPESTEELAFRIPDYVNALTSAVMRHKDMTEAGRKTPVIDLVEKTTPFVPEVGAKDKNRCWCTTCRPITFDDMRFVVCPDCGNKRCPKAHNHENACTGSNAVGQKGSSWEHVKPAGTQIQCNTELPT